MIHTSVRTGDPPDQGITSESTEFHPTPSVRVTMNDDAGRAVLFRHRVNPALPPDQIAVLTHAGGVVSKVEWDPAHRESLGVWAVLAERWARARIAAAVGAP
jgi:hypothetical protein